MIKIRLSFIAFILFAHSAIAQNEEIVPKKYSFGIGVGANNWFGSREIYNKEILKTGATTFNNIGFNIALDCGYFHNEKTCIESGVGLTQYSFAGDLSLSKITFGDLLNPATGLFYQTHFQLTSVEVAYNLTSLTLPIRIRYLTNKGNWRFTMSTGLLNNFLLAQKVSGQVILNNRSTNEGTAKSQYGYATYTATAMAGAGIRLQLKGSGYLQMEPQFQYQFTRINKNGEEEHPFGVAVLFSGGMVF